MELTLTDVVCAGQKFAAIVIAKIEMRFLYFIGMALVLLIMIIKVFAPAKLINPRKGSIFGAI